MTPRHAPTRLARRPVLLQNKAVPTRPQLWPPARGRATQDQPVPPLCRGGAGSQGELPLPSASQSVTRAPDQSPRSVDQPLCLHSVPRALIIVLIRAVLILTSPVPPSLPPSRPPSPRLPLRAQPQNALPLLLGGFRSTSGVPGSTSPVV